MKNILVITILFFLSGNVFSQTQAYKKMLKEYYTGTVRGPFNIPARMKAGFTVKEMEALSAL